eukprot:53370_1
MFILFFVLCIIDKGLSQNWTLLDLYQGNNFFDQFVFYDYIDYTHGYVNYVNQTTATNLGLINSTLTTIYMGADHTNIATGRGRNSIRIASKKHYDYGLFIIKLLHMPTGCGTWPAFWLVGPDWPQNGEIDIIEGVDNQIGDQSTLHTRNGCDFKGKPKNFTGHEISTNCYEPITNQGCGIKSNNANSYGKNLNENGGGLFATKWDNDGIQIWFWNTKEIPSNADSNLPDPLLWGIPYASWPFGSWCTPNHFKQMNITFDLTFCGQWDNFAFPNDCPQQNKEYKNCKGYVQNYPQGFEQAYWVVDYVKVFQ